MQKLEAQDRPATEAEKQILVRYVGWGGLPQVFDSWNEQWKEERERLESLLTEDELESARAIGLTRWQTYRHVIFPQAMRHILPPLAGQAASIIKDSSLLSVLGIEEFTLAAQQVNSATYSTLESYLPLAVGYLALTLPVSFLARRLEDKFRYET